MGEAGGEEEKVSLLQLSPFFASIFPLFPQKRLILRLTKVGGCAPDKKKMLVGKGGGVPPPRSEFDDVTRSVTYILL